MPTEARPRRTALFTGILVRLQLQIWRRNPVRACWEVPTGGDPPHWSPDIHVLDLPKCSRLSNCFIPPSFKCYLFQEESVTFLFSNLWPAGIQCAERRWLYGLTLTHPGAGKDVQPWCPTLSFILRWTCNTILAELHDWLWGNWVCVDTSNTWGSAAQTTDLLNYVNNEEKHWYFPSNQDAYKNILCCYSKLG